MMKTQVPARLLALLALCGLMACKIRDTSATLRSVDDAATSGSAAGGPADFGDQVQINMDRLRAAAFARCQGPWVKPVVQPVPVLDPPANPDKVLDGTVSVDANGTTLTGSGTAFDRDLHPGDAVVIQSDAPTELVVASVESSDSLTLRDPPPTGAAEIKITGAGNRALSGTVSFSTYSKTMTGSGTSFKNDGQPDKTEVHPGDVLKYPDSWLVVASIQSPTSLTLKIGPPRAAQGIRMKRLGGRFGLGMTYQEELEVHVPNVMDKDNFYMFAKPRAALNTQPVDLYLDRDLSGTFKRVRWEELNPDYTSPRIWPPIDKAEIPAAGRYLTELIMGHANPAGGWPQVFDLRSNAYVRFSGFPPMNAGASFRLATHGLWSVKKGKTTQTEFNDADFTAPEDFAVVRTMMAAVKDQSNSLAYVVVEGEAFCGALSLDMNIGAEASVTVDGYWYTRGDFNWEEDSNTGLAAYSSMFWMDAHDTPGYSGDQAHDSDTMRVKYKDGTETVHKITMPTAKLKVWDFSVDEAGNDKEVVGWALANEDRDPLHYRYFDAALGASNFINRASYKVDVLESNVKTGARLMIHWTDGEYLDNVVGVSTLRESFPKATRPEDYKHFKFKTTAYLEGHIGCIGTAGGKQFEMHTWGTKFWLADPAAPQPLVWSMTKTDGGAAPSGAPRFMCAQEGGKTIKAWPGVGAAPGAACIDADCYKLATIVP